MTRDQAKELCNLFPRSAYTRDVGMGDTEDGGWLCGRLKALFPEFNWRVILDRSGERSRWTLTVDDDDPREHYFERLGGHCVHCGRSAREISRIEEVNGDDEFLSELETVIKEQFSKNPRPQHGGLIIPERFQ